MDILSHFKILFLCFLLFLTSSCAKIGYLYEQGIGQAKLILDAKNNEVLLGDSKIPKDVKDKIREIEKYKKYFYEYWHLPETEIYSKTNLLDRDAVTYLVIASEKRKIKPLKNCFFIAGCFPYLGFFELKSAKKHVKTLNEKGYDTYLRRVLAYSTLGNLDDPILSTFFKYSKYDLAETIFHELFHTIFFIKGEVDLNENLANYFGKEMLKTYFSKESEEVKKHLSSEGKYKILKAEIVKNAKELQEILKGDAWEKQKEEFVSTTFLERIKAKCEQIELDNCWPLKIKWNNAVFSAFLTYEKNQGDIENLASKFNNIREFFHYIESEFEKYEDESKGFEDFESYLFRNRDV